MESKKINQLATNVSPQTSDLTIIGDPTTGVSKKITLLQIANLFATTGTVTSVGVTETGDALTITGSPITTAGTINIGFAGAATQYVRGDGALADFPTSTGGGSSVSYYLNSSVSQGTIGGVAYRQLSKTPIAGAGTDITISANGYVASYITDSNDPALLEVPAGNFNCEFYFSVNSNAHNPNVYAELYKYDGTTFTLLGSNVAIPEYLTNGTTLSAYYFAMPIAVASLTITDRLAIRIYVNVDTRIVTLHTENSHLCQVVTTFSKGLTTLNSLTRQTQYFATGTSGTDFAISSSLATHTFNLPVASATNTGKLSSTDWSTFNGKEPAITSGTSLQYYRGDKTFQTLNTSIVPELTNLYYTDVRARASLSFVAGSGAYNSTTGVITIPTNNTQITNGANYITLASLSATSPIFYNSTTGVISSQAASDTLEGYVTTGTQTIAGLKAFNDAITGNSGIAFLNGVMPPITSSYYSGIGGNSQGISIVTRPVSTNYTNNLYFPSASNSYTFPNATGTIALTSDLTSGTVTSVAALTLGTTGTDLSSTVANGTTTPVITLNVPTASATNRGALSSTDWSTFNSKQSALTNPVTGTGTTNYLSKFTAASTIGDSAITDNGTTVTLVSRALSGTTADFLTTTASRYLQIRDAGTSTPSLRSVNDTIAQLRAIAIEANTISLRTGASSGLTVTEALLISATGAATFSSSVTANSASLRASGALNMYVTDNSNYSYIQNSGATSGANNLGFYVSGANPDLFIKANGNVGIGITTPSYQLQLSTDSAAKPSTNTWTIASDSRIKENINPYTKGLEVLMAINPVTYDYNGKAGFDKIENNIGIIAQDVIDVLPESISTYMAKLNEDDDEQTELYNFNSHALTYVLINAIKELKAEIETLKSK